MNLWKDYPFEGAVAVLFDFGDVSPELLASKNSVTDLNQTWEKLRVRLIPCDIEGILRRHAPEPSEVETLVRQWERLARHVPESTREPLRENVRFFLAVRRVLQTEHACAAAINCHAMPRHDLRLPCTAMVELHRDGVLAACEMDVNGLLSAMLLTHVAERPAFMGNVLPGSDVSTIEISHCVAPPNMLPGLAGYEFADRHGNPEQVTAAIELPQQGEATLARISPDLERIHVGLGQIVSAHHKGVCRNSVTIRLPDCGTFLDNKFESHYAFVCGDVSAALSHHKAFRATT